ncbi:MULTISPECIES: DUF799 domain-containing protein [Nitrospirillum]|uniref:Lipoprotein n=1 Tax=Nitrospirillum amazonense TaxID=28077 RepID=A0A560F6Y4_9PROT|nr:GNA1162 family protein [Nitrospirillum amazonense]MEC4593057.1 GNA1162 family protein [Nitrospirillum amazonense]TWB17386.1 hypothetical protein FBZ88_12554 [Nitrospirillum amazonense]TWB62171.1 hypothetical protein FBZ92_105106 [Nitrospirillum amazonense]
MLKVALRRTAVAALLALTAACAHKPPPKDYTAYRSEDPHSILVIPVTNKSTQVDAPDNFLATLAVPLAERGYYVFPVNMVKRTMEDDGLGDADMVRAADPRRLANLFGADAVLYAEIENWDASYIVVSASTTVRVHYTLKSGKTGETLWDQTTTAAYSQGAGGIDPISLLVGAVKAAVERAHPSYIRVANFANAQAVNTPDQGLLPGPYDKGYKKN